MYCLKKNPPGNRKTGLKSSRGTQIFFLSLFPTLATNESNIFLYIISYVGRVFVVFVMFLIVV